MLLIYGMLCAIVLAGGLSRRSLLESDWGLYPAASSAPTLNAVGINVELEHLPPADQAARLQALHNQGFGWVRQRFDWQTLEPQAGQYDWTSTDTLLTQIAAQALEVVVVLDGSPAWARAPRDQAPVDNALAPPANVHDFARFAGAFAHRYGAQVRYYQLWDEPNIAPHWGDRHVDPIGYAQLLKTAAAAIRAADADAVILTAALAPTQDQGHTALDEVTFLQRMLAAQADAAFDVIAIQPYGFGYAPEALAQRRAVLNLARAGWIRRAMQAAGQGATPLWAVRYGWNQRTNNIWGTVTPADQTAYAARALTRVQGEWPWLTAMAWAIERPQAPPDDPRWGFALTPSLAAALQTADVPAQSVAQLTTTNSRAARQAVWVRFALLALALIGLAWRGTAAVRLLAWRSWAKRYVQGPEWIHALAWGALLFIYYGATWPPLIVACGIGAALLAAVQPRVALWLALALLPFHFQHKELALVNNVLLIPPTQALLFALLPTLAWRIRHLGQRPISLTFVPLDWLAPAWLVISLLAAANVWHWPAYARGAVDLALAPVLLYAAVRLLVDNPQRWHGSAYALLLGGLLAAVIGLGGWLQGEGTAADGVRRLIGPHFSPNHTALYLERTLFLGVGLAVAAPGRVRWLLSGAVLLLGVALVLTASRGALLLALPAGGATFALLMPRRLPISRLAPPRHTGRLIGIAGVLIVAAVAGAGILLGWVRLTNSATVIERFAIWRSTLALWRDFPLLGVGPEGFFWRYPAYIPQGAAMDPNLRHPHNVWLEAAAMWGMLGLAWLAGALLAAAVTLRRSWLAQGDDKAEVESERSWRSLWPVVAGLVAGLVAALAHGQVDAFSALADLAGWNWAALGLLAVYAAGESSSTTRL